MKILIPIDGSDCSRATLAWAAQTLSKENNEFILLTVVADPMVAEYEIEDGKVMLKEAQNFLTEHGFKVSKADYFQGDPVETICMRAEKEMADQVLIGSHGRSGIVKLLLGSVSEGVLEKCKVPVFVYRNVTRSAVTA